MLERHNLPFYIYILFILIPRAKVPLPLYLSHNPFCVSETVTVTAHSIHKGENAEDLQLKKTEENQS